MEATTLAAIGLDTDIAGLDPGSILGSVGLMDHHALGEEASKRLVQPGMAGCLHRAGEEARIEQVQDRMLDAADILVNGKEAVDDLAIGRALGAPGIGET